MLLKATPSSADAAMMGAAVFEHRCGDRSMTSATVIIVALTIAPVPAQRAFKFEAEVKIMATMATAEKYAAAAATFSGQSLETIRAVVAPAMIIVALLASNATFFITFGFRPMLIFVTIAVSHNSHTAVANADSFIALFECRLRRG